MTETTTNQHTSKISDSVLASIRKSDVKPIPKFIHAIRNDSFWLLWGISVVAGACSVALIAFTELNAGWEYYEMTHDNALTFFANTIPVVWIILLLGMVGLGYYNVRNTKHGYKYPVPVIILLSVGISVCGGVLIHTYGMSKDIDEVLDGFVPFHHSVDVMRRDHWLQESKGLYAGVVVDVDADDDIFLIEGFDGKSHRFSSEFLFPSDLERIMPDAEIGVMSVRDVIDSNILVACRLFILEAIPDMSFRDIQKHRSDIRKELEKRSEIFSNPSRINPCMERMQLTMPPS